MPTLRRLAAVLLIAVLAGAALAAPAVPVRYDGHRVVRVQVRTADDLDFMRSISNDPWSHGVGIGTVDYRVSPEAFAALEASGIPFRVLIDDVQASVDKEHHRLAAEGAGDGFGGGGGYFEDFRDFATIENHLAALQATNPAIAQLIDIGDSLEGRDIWALRITGPDPDPKPGILYNSCQHAREWISPMVTVYLADQLVNGYGVDSAITALVDQLEIFIIPVVNPDGYVYSWGPDRLWRKNRRDNGDGTFGVDTNRNWGYGWGGGGSSGSTNDPTYRGTAPFSEPETQVMRDFYLAHPNIVASIDFHSYGQLALYPWAYQTGGPGDDGQHALLGNAMTNAIAGVHGMGYVAGPVFETLYQASGGSVDWTWGDQGVISYTIELRDTGFYGFVLPPEQILPTCEENLPAAFVLAGAAASGVIYDFPAGLPTFIGSDAPTTVSLSVTPITSGELDPASGRLLYALNGGAMTESVLTYLGGNDYEATLPAVPCGTDLDFYFEVDALTGTPYVAPTDAPADLYSTDVLDVTEAFTDDFETDTGWSVENVNLIDGGWDRGVPAGGGDRGDPPADFDASGSCYLTDNVDGNSDVDGGPTRLMSPAVDLAGMTNPQLEYARWFTTDDAVDQLTVELSDDDGASWALVENVGNSAGWTLVTVPVTDYVGATSTVRVRFSAIDDPNNSVVEGAVDAVRFLEASCAAVAGDVDGDGDVDFADLLLLLGSWGPCGGCPADLDFDGVVGFSDVLILIGNWT